LPGKADDPAQRLLERISEDDVTVVTEPIPVKHGKAIVLRNSDHKEVPQAAAPSSTPASVPAPSTVPPTASAAAAASASAPARQAPLQHEKPNGKRKDPMAAALRRDGSAGHAAEAAASRPATLGDDLQLARSVLAEALFRDLGAPGSKV